MCEEHLQVGSHGLVQGLPTIIASVTGQVSLKDLTSAQVRGMDVVELRVDLFSNQNAASLVYYMRSVVETIPTLLTIRCREEGGKFDGDEQARLLLYKQLIPFAHAVDVELESSIAEDVLAEAKSHGRMSILSYHDFEETPDADDLSKLANQAYEMSNDAIFKVATKVHGYEDVLMLTRFLTEHDGRDLIVLGMGECGIKTRIFFPALVSLATYAAFGDATAPGQLGLDEMASLLQKFYPGYRK